MLPKSSWGKARLLQRTTLLEKVCRSIKAKLKQLPVPLYPLHLQKEFAGVAARASCRVYRDIESLRARQAGNLFESL